MGLLKRLRTETRRKHEEVEQGNLAGLIIDHSITKDQYYHLLYQNYLAYLAVEKKVVENKALLAPTLKVFADTSKTQRLRKDLSQTDTTILPDLDFNPMISQGALVGMLYVTEGSMLGGMMMAKHLEHCEQLDIEKHYFFSGDSEALTERWKDFRASVGVLDLSEEEMDAAVNAALATFDLFKKAFSQRMNEASASTPIIN